MWELYGLEDEDILWTGVAFLGGIAGEQSGPCGAVSAATVCAGLGNRCPLSDKQAAKRARFQARAQAGELVRAFKERFGSIACRDLVGIDFSQPGAYHGFVESGIWEDKCKRYVQFMIEKLYELEKERGAAPEL